MPESRDRLSRPGDASIFIRRRRSIGSLQILAYEQEISARSPFRWGTIPMTGTARVATTRSNATTNMRDRRPTRSFGRTRSGISSVLPSWYPRKALGDITPIVQAIKRRQARLREGEGLQLMSPSPQGQSVHTSYVHVVGAPLEDDHCIISPSPTTKVKHCAPSVGKVPKILLDITHQNAKQLDFLTPQKKLLNSIDKVEKVVLEELNRLKRTPTAKRAQRVKKVRTLMSMR